MNQKMQRLFFQPTPNYQFKPTDRGLEYEEVAIKTKDGSALKGWMLKAVGEASGSVLHLHGNADNMGSHLDHVCFLPEKGFNVLMFDYRGFGESAGEPSIEGAYEDGQAALDYLMGRDEVDSDRVCLFGQSLGAALSFPLMYRNENLKGMLAESPFTSYREVAEQALGGNWFMKAGAKKTAEKMVGKLELDPDQWACKIDNRHVMIIHGVKDKVTPYWMGQKLYESLGKRKDFWTMENVGHLGGLEFYATNYPKKLKIFFNKCVKAKHKAPPRAYNPYV